MPRRYGEAMHQLLEAIAEIQLHVVVVDEHGRFAFQLSSVSDQSQT